MPEKIRRIANHIVNDFESRFMGKEFIVNCAGCGHYVPTGVTEFPFQSILAVCTWCGATARYRPSEIEYGVPDHLPGPAMMSAGSDPEPTSLRRFR